MMDSERVGKMVSILEFHVAEVARLEALRKQHMISASNSWRLSRYDHELQGMVIALHTLGVYEDVRREFYIKTGTWLPSYEATLVSKALEGPTEGDENG